MKNKEFIQKYEELLDSGYCECNELNCLDNNPPRKILSIMKEQQEEIERLNNIIKGLDNTIENLEEVIEHKDSIINKANKYIEEHTDKLKTTRVPKIDFNYKDLLKILQGR